MPSRGTQLRGLIATVRSGRIPARTLAIADSRSLVRSMFLASAVRMELLPYIRGGREFSEIVGFAGATRRERLRAWLGVGVELGELSLRRGRYDVRGVRARALADGDALLCAHYRSMLDYQIGPYGELGELLDSDDGRDDLARYADDIAQVSLAAAPFVASFVRRIVTEVRPGRVLDIGCGTGVYTKVVLDADSQVRVEGIDLADEVIALARADLDRGGYGSRAQLHVGDIRTWAEEASTTFDLVMLLNNIYYFDPASRVALFRDLRRLLTDRGQLLVVSMVAPGSIAAAHLHFMLTSQRSVAALPEPTALARDLAESGYRVIDSQVLVPAEPFVGLRAERR
jgi:4-hydroxy-2,2'-bipyrrole-5-carbaldehyde O-methyltransferase